MKKIIIIGSAYPFRGGLASFNERMAKGLQDMGHEVQIHTFSLQYPDFLFPGKTQFSKDPPPENLDIQVSLNSVNPLSWWRLGERLRKEKPDLVICRFWLPFMGPSLGTVLRRIRKNRHTRILSLIDNIIPHEKRLGDKPLAKYFTKAVDAFVVMSRSVEEEMKDFSNGRPVVYIPHPIYDNFGELIKKEAACHKLDLDPTLKYLMFFGFIRDYKGLDLLLEAMNDPRIKARKDIRLIVAGEYYANRKKYEALIDHLDIRKQLILHTDFISNEAVRFYFGVADLIVQPYKSATQSGISQMAYHFEKPTLVTNVGGLPEIVDHGKAGYVVEVNTKAVADAILDFYDNDRASIFLEHVKSGKKKYSWESMLNGMMNLSFLPIRK